MGHGHGNINYNSVVLVGAVLLGRLGHIVRAHPTALDSSIVIQHRYWLRTTGQIIRAYASGDTSRPIREILHVIVVPIQNQQG